MISVVFLSLCVIETLVSYGTVGVLEVFFIILILI